MKHKDFCVEEFNTNELCGKIIHILGIKSNVNVDSSGIIELKFQAMNIYNVILGTC